MAKRKVLIVDDSEVVAGILEQLLAGSGFETCRATNGVEAIEKAYSAVPDVIIMDVEMPLMRGYQASRVLKSRRGVRDIPIIMHTSLSEDKDKYWAVSSGADAFVTKDFASLDRILSAVTQFAGHPPLKEELIREDARKVNHDTIFEMLGATFDRQLFQAALLGQMGEISRSSVGSPTVTIGLLMQLLRNVCEAQITAIVLQTQKQGHVYIMPQENVFLADVDSFLEVCLGDAYAFVSTLNIESIKRQYLGIESRDDFEKARLDGKRISSYLYRELRGKGGKPVGTLHLGSFANNYFTDTIAEGIDIFAQGAGLVLENALLFREVTEIKERIQHVFAKFVPEEVIADFLEKHSDADLMVGEKRRVVVLFSDIRSFATISETNDPDAVVSFLNRYFDVQVSIIKRHGGNVDKFIGDAIFSIFGAPVSYEDNAERALAAAVEMVAAVDSIDVGNLNLPEGKLRIGIGLHEGDVIIGNIGASTKFDYTAIGDTVNLAARLEGLTKYYHRDILLTDAIRSNVSGDFPLREIDCVKVKGKDIATALFAVERDERILRDEYMDMYKKGLKLYRMGSFATALDYFNRLQTLHDDDPVARILAGRCAELIASPPETWDGAVAFDFK
jgi:class 3 adenylate cyclase/CheY-like chemotaxis protein